MKFDDLMTLVKAGYKPSEVKELLSLTTESESPAEVPTQEAVETTETKDVIPDTKEEAVTDSTEPNYKALYEETMEKLRKAQISNTRENIKGTEEKSDQDTLNELMKSFM